MKGISKYTPGPIPQLLEPRRNPLDRTGEQTVIKYAKPSHGRIITPEGKDRADAEADRSNKR
jgi:hypothetical protein